MSDSFVQRHRREDQSNHRARLKAGTVLSSRGVEQSVEEVYFPSSRVVFCLPFNHPRLWPERPDGDCGGHEPEPRSPRRLKVYMWSNHTSGMSTLRGDGISASEDDSSQGGLVRDESATIEESLDFEVGVALRSGQDRTEVDMEHRMSGVVGTHDTGSYELPVSSMKASSCRLFA